MHDDIYYMVGTAILILIGVLMGLYVNHPLSTEGMMIRWRA